MTGRHVCPRHMRSDQMTSEAQSSVRLDGETHCIEPGALHGTANISLSRLMKNLGKEPQMTEPKTKKPKSKFHQAATIADQFKAIDAAEEQAHHDLTKRFTDKRLTLINSYQDDPELTIMVSSLLESEQSERPDDNEGS